MIFRFTEALKYSLSRYKGNTAFFIQGHKYSYSDLEREIARIQHIILEHIPENEKYIGLVHFDDIETYAAIYALWFSGKAFVLISRNNPSSRNTQIIRDMNLSFLINSQDIPSFSIPEGNVNFIKTTGCGIAEHTVREIKYNDTDDAYVLFTSGSTGTPKGVPVSFRNLNAFLEGFMTSAGTFSEEDRFLQVYDLSFDASVPCYTIPLLAGGSIYTVSPGEIKFLSAYRLIKDHKLTVIKMTPSMLTLLQPWFHTIRLDHVRHCMFGGEAFSSKLAAAWEKCVPNALIQNVYGPTEATVICLFYNWNRAKNAGKSYNNVVALGQTFGRNSIEIVDDDLLPVKGTGKGELLISGDQVMKGYWNRLTGHDDGFIYLEKNNQQLKYYRTGDIVFKDHEGDIFYCGRKDSQVQIQGYRVELGEIEKHARDYCGERNLLAMTKENPEGNFEIHLFVEGEYTDAALIGEYLSSRLPFYMMPEKIHNVRIFPRQTSGKTDRESLLNLLTDYSDD